ncbi:M3 family oligoendopeptidase [Bacillus sp. FJAT-49736]|nr:M3 family oligoendopeptidase [Bacillus sp. FJAT-49736]
MKMEMKYARPNMEDFKQKFDRLLKRFHQASTFEEQNNLFLMLNQLRNEFEAMEQLAYLRHMINLNDEEYKEEQAFFDQITPIYQAFVTKYYHAILNASFREQLENRWGTQIFKLAELKVKIYTDEVSKELQLEKQLIGSYFSLLAKAEAEFNSEKMTPVQLSRFTISEDRGVRKKAYESIFSYYADHEEEFDDILDELIKVRTKIARKLGYKSFTQLGYDRLGRSNYSPEDVKVYRNQVKQYGVPFISKLREKQRVRIGVEKLKFYDERVYFKTGAPKLLGDTDQVIKKALQMFSELSSETKEFFDYMVSSGNMDLISKKGKRGGAFATFIGTEKAPFIFANLVGTANDARVLAHEAGHAFQFYMSRNTPIPEYISPTYDAAEIHSFTMERLVWPWMELFFGEDAEKYRFSHLIEAFILMPWANAIDEFQHYLYDNPSATKEERKVKWREMERIYMPEKDYDGNEFLEGGGSFYQISHLFETPFYFIDYDLAHNCAVQLWIRYNENRVEGWNDFLKICQVGGSESLVEIVNRARLLSPFEEGSLHYIIDYVDRWVTQFDDQKF